MVVGGKVYHEAEIQVPASKVWELMGTLELPKLLVQNLPNFVEKIDAVQGHGEAGTILHVKFAPDVPGPGWQKEKFTVVDKEKRLKVAEVIEGGFLELGYTLHRFIGEIVETSPSSCIVKASVEYELTDEAGPNAVFVAATPLGNIFEIAKNHLLPSSKN